MLFFRKRLPITLIEVTVAFGLMAVLLFVLFSCFTQSTKLLAKLEGVKPIVAKREQFYHRMLQIASTVQPSSIQIDKASGKRTSPLLFTFENGLDRELVFSGLVEASIILDRSHRLTLNIWPTHGDTPPREEVLLNNVFEALWEVDKDKCDLSLTYTDKRKEHYTFSLPKESTEGLPLKSKKIIG